MSTPEAPGHERRGAIDVARVLALGVVVLGHLTMAVIDRGADGALRGTNLLALRPAWLWLGVLSPMPVFFAAAGWANAGVRPADAAPRLRALLGLTAGVVGTWSLLVVVAAPVTGDAGILGDGARLATQPFWFLAAYVPLAAAGPTVERLARRPVLTVVVALCVVAVLDVARFVGDAPRSLGWPNFFLAWGLPWVIGTAWRRRCEAGAFPERRVGWVLLVAGVAASVLLVRLGGYSPALIDAVPGRRSNTTPPTLYTAVAALTQTGALLAGASLLDRPARRWPALWRRAGAAAVPVYALHLSGLALCSAVVAAGVPVPTRLTAAFWWTRPLWDLAVLTITAALAGLVALARSGLDRRTATSERAGGPSTAAIAVAVLVATAGGALVGLRGPQTPANAVLCAASFLVAWALLRARPLRPAGGR